LVDKFQVNGCSLRLKTFKEKGLVCVSCKRKGTHFRLQSSSETEQLPHLGLWSDDGVQFSKDHIIPKKYGGYDCLKNMQTMCVNCNSKKGSSFNESDFQKGYGGFSYEEALKMKTKEKELIKLEQFDDIKMTKAKLLKEMDIFFPSSERNLVSARLTKIRVEHKLDPFQVLGPNHKDVIYYISYVDKLIEISNGKFPKKMNAVRQVPKKIINARIDKFLKEKDKK